MKVLKIFCLVTAIAVLIAVGGNQALPLVKNIHEQYGLPHAVVSLNNQTVGVAVEENGERIVRLTLKYIMSDLVYEVVKYAQRNDIQKIVIEIHSGGGDGWETIRILGLLESFKAGGGIVVTECHGIALSAGFIIFNAGTIGHRHASPKAMFMLHKFFLKGFVAPSKIPSAVSMLNLMNSTIFKWLETRGNLTASELFIRCDSIDYFMSGRTAHEYGYVDILTEGDK